MDNKTPEQVVCEHKIKIKANPLGSSSNGYACFVTGGYCEPCKSCKKENQENNND